jgi:hypothetical protein
MCAMKVRLPSSLVIFSYDPRSAYWCDTLPLAVRDVRDYLDTSATPGEWATILGRNGELQRRYITDVTGVAIRVD